MATLSYQSIFISDTHLGSGAYEFLLWLNRWFNFTRRKLGFGYWSLSAYLKHRVREAVKYIGNFEQAVIHEARERGMDGVICGHIHHAVITDMNGITYANCGDWVESCTALAEAQDGSLQLIRWADESLPLLDNIKIVNANCDSDGRVVSTR